MSVLKEVMDSGVQFYVKSGRSINGSENWAIVVRDSTVISIDDFQPDGFDALHQALYLKEFKNSRHAFMVVDGRIRNLDIYLVDILPKKEYDVNIIRALAKSRDQFSFFDVETREELMAELPSFTS